MKIGEQLFLKRGFLDPFVSYVEALVFAGTLAVACGLSAAGAVRSRRAWGVWVSAAIAVVEVLCIYPAYFVVRVGPVPGLISCFVNLHDIWRSSCVYYLDTGQAPGEIGDLVQKQGTGEGRGGNLPPGYLICPYDRSHPYPYTEAGGSSYVLAPLDKVFFDEKFVADNPGVVLCAYCTVVHSRRWPQRTYVTTDDHEGITSGEDLQAWESAQAEAVTWLADEFPLSELERFAQSAERHRRELASAILKYRQDKKGPEAQRGNNRAP
jgi:hypothetical protein